MNIFRQIRVRALLKLHYMLETPKVFSTLKKYDYTESKSKNL